MLWHGMMLASPGLLSAQVGKWVCAFIVCLIAY